MNTSQLERLRSLLREETPDRRRFENFVDRGKATINLYAEIGIWGITAADFVAELSRLDVSEIDLHINSPGGEIFDGIAICNALRSHPATVTTYVDSLAASIASVIAMAGDRIVMAPNSQLMIHDGSGLCIGNAADMRATAELLDRQSDNIASVYQQRAGGTVSEWRDRMTAETWYTADEAVAAGLADEVSSVHSLTGDNSPQNSWDLSVFRYPSRAQAPAPQPVNTAVDCPPEPVAAPEAAEPEPELTVEADQPAAETPEPEPEGAQVVVEEPELAPDPWATATAHLITSAPSPDDAFARLTEALR